MIEKSDIPKSLVHHIKEHGRPVLGGKYVFDTELTIVILHNDGRLVVLNDSDEVLAQATREEWGKGEWVTHTNWFRVRDHIKCVIYGDPSTANNRVSKKINEFLRVKWREARGDGSGWKDKSLLTLLDQMHDGIFALINERKWDE